MREENAMKPVYTVGYVSYRPEELISTLRSFGVSCLVDWRDYCGRFLVFWRGHTR